MKWLVRLTNKSWSIPLKNGQTSRTQKYLLIFSIGFFSSKLQSEKQNYAVKRGGKAETSLLPRKKSSNLPIVSNIVLLHNFELDFGTSQL